MLGIRRAKIALAQLSELARSLTEDPYNLSGSGTLGAWAQAVANGRIASTLAIRCRKRLFFIRVAAFVLVNVAALSSCRPIQDPSVVRAADTAGVATDLEDLCRNFSTRITTRDAALAQRVLRAVGLAAPADPSACPAWVAKLKGKSELRLPLHQATNLSALRYFTNFSDITLELSAVPSGLPTMAHPHLRHLGLSWIGRQPPHPLRKRELVEQLGQLTSVRSLGVWEFGLPNAEWVSALTQLEQIFLDGNAISDLTPFARLAHLEALYLRRNRVSDLTPLTVLFQLRYLSLAQNRVTKLDTLGLMPQLINLDLAANRGLKSILGVQFLPNLRVLNVSRTGLKNIAPLTVIRGLSSLLMDGNDLEDVSPLTSLPLVELYLRDNKIVDVAPLGKIPTLRKLLLRNNPIEELPEFPRTSKIHHLDLEGTRITDPCPALRLPEFARQVPGSTATVILPKGDVVGRWELRHYKERCRL